MITKESQKLRDDIRSGKLDSETEKFYVEKIYLLERKDENKLLTQTWIDKVTNSNEDSPSTIP